MQLLVVNRLAASTAYWHTDYCEALKLLSDQAIDLT